MDFIIPGFGATYIAVFEDNEGAKSLAQNPVCTSNAKHIDVRPPFLQGIISCGKYLVIRVRVFEQCNIPPLRVLHITSCTEDGGCFSPCSVQSMIKTSFFCGCLRFRMIMRNSFFLVQLVGPVLGTSFSKKSGIIGVYLSQFSRIA